MHVYWLHCSVALRLFNSEHAIGRNEKDGGCRFSRVHYVWKWFQKANWRLLKDKHKKGGYLLCFAKVVCRWVFFFATFFCFCPQCILVKCTSCNVFMVNCASLNAHFPLCLYLHDTIFWIYPGVCDWPRSAWDITFEWSSLRWWVRVAGWQLIIYIHQKEYGKSRMILKILIVLCFL